MSRHATHFQASLLGLAIFRQTLVPAVIIRVFVLGIRITQLVRLKVAFSLVFKLGHFWASYNAFEHTWKTNSKFLSE